MRCLPSTWTSRQALPTLIFAYRFGTTRPTIGRCSESRSFGQALSFVKGSVRMEGRMIVQPFEAICPQMEML